MTMIDARVKLMRLSALSALAAPEPYYRQREAPHESAWCGGNLHSMQMRQTALHLRQ